MKTETSRLTSGTEQDEGLNRDFAAITPRSADDQQAKLEGTLLAALVKRPAWNLGRLDEPGYLHASLTTDDGYRGFIGNHRGGTWWWEAYNNGQPIADGRVPAGPTANMRAAEQTIAQHRAKNGGA